LRKGIHLRGYAQKNPEQEYKRESFELFQMMLGAIKSETVQDLSRVHIPTKEEMEALEAQQRSEAEHMQMHFEHDEMDSLTGETHEDPRMAARNAPQQRANGQMQVNLGGVAVAGQAQAATNTGDTDVEGNPYADMNISRNAVCPCGSGLKYKQCHGKI